MARDYKLDNETALFGRDYTRIVYATRNRPLTPALSPQAGEGVVSSLCPPPALGRVSATVSRWLRSHIILGRGTKEAESVARERRLGAREVEEIFSAFAEAMRELPPDIEAGWLDAQGDLRLAPDIARKLRTARRVRQLLQELRQREREG
jgi:hypothetical protein